VGFSFADLISPDIATDIKRYPFAMEEPMMPDTDPPEPDVAEASDEVEEDEDTEEEREARWRFVEEYVGFELDDEFRAFAEEADVGAIAAELDRRRPQSRVLPPDPTPPGRTAQPGDRERQICVRLWPEQYDELAALAAEYALTPTAMARLLVRRGIKAGHGEGSPKD
jgi:hypothetical protein